MVRGTCKASPAELRCKAGTGLRRDWRRGCKLIGETDGAECAGTHVGPVQLLEEH